MLEEIIMARVYRRYRRRRRTDGEVPSPAPMSARRRAPSGRRDAGPTAVLGVQAKLRVNVPGDRYEREADAVADAVAAGRSAPTVSTLGTSGVPGASAQRQAVEEEEEEPVQRQALDEEEEQPVQRQAGEEEPVVQAKEDASPGGRAAPGRTGQRSPTQTAAGAMAHAGAGAPLPSRLRIRIEQSLGRDLSDMRVHTTPAAREASAALNAKAVTRGRDVYLGPQGSVSDLRLMAHEATHVVQQQDAPRRAAPAQREEGEGAAADARTQVERTAEAMDAVAETWQQEGATAEASSVESTLRGWYNQTESALETVETTLGGDAALQQSVRRAYQQAVRAYMPHASEAVGRTLPELYQEHHRIIHPWAWLPSSANAAANALLSGLPERERQHIRVIMSQEAVAVPDARVHEYFSTEVAVARYRTPQGVAVTFGSGIDSEFERGLQSIMGYLIGDQNLEVNRTVVLPLNLTAYGDDHAAYRFTYVQHVDAEGSPTSREILIERLGEVGTQGLEGADLDAARDRFGRYGFSFGRGWRDAERRIVLQAVRQVPDAALARVRGMTFERARQHPARPNVGGDYDMETHTLTMYDHGLAARQMHHGVPGQGFSQEAVRAVAHEIGHAIDRAELRRHVVAEEQARQELEREFGEFRTSEGSYEGVDERLDRFNELIEQARTAQEALTTTVTPSGTTYQEEEGGLQETEVSGSRATAFRRAMLQDRQSAAGGTGVRISTYAEEDYGELYAELFSLYVTDPAVLRQLRPHVFEYFENQPFDGGSSGP